MTFVDVCPESVPGPEVILQLTPEESPVTVSEKVCDPPTPRLAFAGLIGFRVIPLEEFSTRGTVTEVLFVGSVLLVAVTVVDVTAIVAGAV